MKDIFQGLNSRQAEAVKATEGRIRVVAGAGTFLAAWAKVTVVAVRHKSNDITINRLIILMFKRYTSIN